MVWSNNNLFNHFSYLEIWIFKISFTLFTFQPLYIFKTISVASEIFYQFFSRYAVFESIYFLMPCQQQQKFSLMTFNYNIFFCLLIHTQLYLYPFCVPNSQSPTLAKLLNQQSFILREMTPRSSVFIGLPSVVSQHFLY